MPTGGLEGGDVSGAEFARARQILASPGETFPAVSHPESIRDKARVAAIAVHDGVDENEGMAQADGALVQGRRLVLDPSLRVAKRLVDGDGDFVMWKAEVALSGAES